jgi:hypothetical protein
MYVTGQNDAHRIIAMLHMSKYAGRKMRLFLYQIQPLKSKTLQARINASSHAFVT